MSHDIGHNNKIIDLYIALSMIVPSEVIVQLHVILHGVTDFREQITT